MLDTPTIRSMEHEVRVYNDPDEDLEDELRPEYDFDYSKAKPNPYAERALRQKVLSEPDQALPETDAGRKASQQKS